MDLSNLPQNSGRLFQHQLLPTTKEEGARHNLLKNVLFLTDLSYLRAIFSNIRGLKLWKGVVKICANGNKWREKERGTKLFFFKLHGLENWIILQLERGHS